MLKLLLISALSLSTTVQGSCIPDDVPSMHLTPDYILNWEAPYSHICPLSSYSLDVYDPETNLEIHFQTLNASLLSYDLTGLEMCTRYSISITPITTEFQQGATLSEFVTTPALENSNLNLNLLNTTVSTSSAVINWELIDKKVSKCVSLYQVTYDDENGVSRVINTTEKSAKIPRLVPCRNHAVEVSAFGSQSNFGESRVISVTGAPQVPSAPKVLSISTSSDSVRMSFGVPRYSENSCLLTYLEVTTSGANPQNVSIIDSPKRAPIEVTIEGLLPSHNYSSTVILNNIVGRSAPVNITFTTLALV